MSTHEFNRTRSNGISRRSLFVWLLSAAAGLALSACSNSNHEPTANAAATSTAAGAGALPDPCSLITPAEVETALGKGATMTSFFNQRIDMHECRLKPASAGAIEEVVVIVHKADLWDGIKKAMLPPSSDSKLAPGLGDDAFVGRAVGYNVRKGNKYVQVFGAVTNNDAANDKATRYLAERAISRL